jgi:hypothetical protein
VLSVHISAALFREAGSKVAVRESGGESTSLVTTGQNRHYPTGRSPLKERRYSGTKTSFGVQ